MLARAVVEYFSGGVFLSLAIKHTVAKPPLTPSTTTRPKLYYYVGYSTCKVNHDRGHVFYNTFGFWRRRRYTR